MSGCVAASNNSCTSCSSRYYLDQTTKECQVCSLTNCNTCMSAESCSTCVTGYTLSEGQCKLCDIEGCEQCSNTTYACDVCDSNHILSNTKCDLCATQYSNCLQCSSSKCTNCIFGFYLENSECKPCYSIEGCTICNSNEKVCSVCNSTGYYLSVGTCKACDTVTSECVECPSGVCTKCDVGFYFNGNSCSECANINGGCATCNQSKAECLTCKSGYKQESLVGGGVSCKTCQEITPNCASCNNNFVCIECNSEAYTLKSGKCVSCGTAFANCNTCDKTKYSCKTCNSKSYFVNSTTGACDLCLNTTSNTCKTCDSPIVCLSCSDGYYLSSSSCNKCNTLTNCQNCTTNGKCTNCTIGYPNSGVCSACTTISPACLTCSTIEAKCLTCSSGYYLKGSTCDVCNNVVTNCAVCPNAKCTQCKEGYSLTENKCVLCSDISGCVMCSTTESGCKMCENNIEAVGGKCTTCKDVNCDSCPTSIDVCEKCLYKYYLSNGGCLDCSTQIGCSECSQIDDSCADCDEGYFKNGNWCSKCGDNCKECSSNAICIECNDTYVLKMDNSCGDCATSIPGCESCSTTGFTCTSCGNGYFLKDGTCSLCSGESSICEKCGYTTQFVCEKCIGNYVVNNGNCVSCGYGFFSNNGICEQCSNLMAGCSQCHQNAELGGDGFVCDYCSEGNGFDDQGNCKLCLTVVDNTGRCVECGSSCELCVNSTYCVKCKIGLVLRSGVCSEYINSEFCVKAEITSSIGCESCKYSISPSGICVALETNNTCAFYTEPEKNVITCNIYYPTTKTFGKGALLCAFESKGGCFKCEATSTLLNVNPPTCTSCLTDGCNQCKNTSICMSCTSGYYFEDDTCSKDELCVSGKGNWCSECTIGYGLKTGVCYNCGEGCSLCDDTSCFECKDGYIFKSRTCVANTVANCLISSNSTCILCNENFVKTSNGNCERLTTENCKFESVDNNNNVKCKVCDNNTILSQDSYGKYICGTEKMARCDIANEFGCERCIEGYYLTGGECKVCDSNCKTCASESTRCVTCNFGYSYDKNTFTCKAIGALSERCDTFLPTSTGCVVCKDGYFLSQQDCIKCDISCLTCINEATKCLECNMTAGYFYDTKQGICVHESKITNCLNITSNGCVLCEDGYYINSQYCFKCDEVCTTCSSKSGSQQSDCTSCNNSFILLPTSSLLSTCVPFNEVEHCLAETNNKCSMCENGYEVSSSGTECISHKNYFMIIGVPVIVVVIVILIILVVAGILGFYISKKLKKIEKHRNICEFEIKRSNIHFFVLEEETGIVSNKTTIDFIDDGGDKVLIPVMEESKELICIGNTKVNTLKVQLSCKDANTKFEMRTNPQLVTLKKGRACEFEVYIKPLCTCKIDDLFVMTCLDVKRGVEFTESLKIDVETQITTRLDPDELICDKTLGKGSFGIVYLGTFRGNKVAIKKMKTIENGEEGMKEFEKEVSMLDKFRCDYIVHFYGAVFIPTNICMVTEFAQFGSLADLMNKRRKTPIDVQIRLKIMIDGALGLQYLHSNGVLHRDVKPDNMLVFSLDPTLKVNGKLTDFGSSRNVNMLVTNMTFTNGIGTPTYMCPEMLEKKKYKTSADIYSFSISLTEVLLWDEPYPKAQFKFPWNVATGVVNGLRPNISSVDKDLQEIITDMWCDTPQDRIKMEAAARRLQEYYDAHYTQPKHISQLQNSTQMIRDN
ncbi:protein serine/threonine kinase, putative [Entamoeba invadens IP1]|uniref:Protein serine/threonine kinase, putative n=1 Tax=Entamoeba invadens IP1 TaxID=370355 RepID=A0A0A1TUF0_ENTIV|nr:protein serine/threonine kinase, putative [Entamoeba invadens IP1]ELP83628.1 protein serine/threonine kinase, putative [Entamoeba invadens IP1]|eukprot:XP_004182974.1 protein serine/threonine kinase, putative [Entamoeba invadens IP1]